MRGRDEARGGGQAFAGKRRCKSGRKRQLRTAFHFAALREGIVRGDTPMLARCWLRSFKCSMLAPVSIVVISGSGALS